VIAFDGPVPDEDEIAAIVLAIVSESSQPAQTQPRRMAIDDDETFGSNDV
jgi:hypothetical protein